MTHCGLRVIYRELCQPGPAPMAENRLLASLPVDLRERLSLDLEKISFESRDIVIPRGRARGLGLLFRPVA